MSEALSGEYVYFLHFLQQSKNMQAASCNSDEQRLGE